MASFWHLWDHFCSIWAPSETTLGSFGRFWSTGSNLDQFPEKKVGHLGPCWTPKSQKVRQKLKKTGSGKQRRKKCSQSSAKAAQCVICTIKTTCFEGSRNIRSGGFWSHFGSLSGSLLDTFSEKTVIEEFKKTDNQKTSKFNEKGSRESSG